MPWWFREFVDRLAFRLMSVLSAKVEAQLELELADVRANLLKRAEEYESQATGHLTAVAQTLTDASTRLGQSEHLSAANEPVVVAHLEQVQRERSSERGVSQGRSALKKSASKSAAKPKRGRGRPPKTASLSASVRPESAVISTDTSAGGPTDGV